MNTLKFISVILPTYNEVENIVPLIQKIQVVLKEPFEIIVVDDNSPDGTSTAVKNFIRISKNKNIHLETRVRDNGLTKSIAHGIAKAKGEVIVWMDCDFSHPPELIPTLLSSLNKGYDIAIASRFVSGGKQKSIQKNESELAIRTSTLFNSLLRVVLRTQVQDFTSGFIAIDRQAILSLLPLRGEYGEYFIDCIVRAERKGFKILEIPFENLPRRSGESKTAPNFKTVLKRVRQYGTAVVKIFFSV